MFELRDYQNEAVAAVYDGWGTYDRVGVVLPTGTGKSIVMAQVALTALSHGNRVLILAHRGELLQQLRRSVRNLGYTKTVGLVKANNRHYDHEIVVASVQTLNAQDTHIENLGARDIILVDEAHHYAADTYRSVLGKFGAFDPTHPSKVAGFTATMHRDGGGLDQVWEKVVFERSIHWAVDNKHLVHPYGLTVINPKLDLGSVAVRAGDFAQGELEAAMMPATEGAVTAILTHAPDRRMIIFAAGVAHAALVAAQLDAAGIATDYVIGSMGDDAREAVYDRFRKGTLQALVTVMVLTEGADFPMCDCVVMLRPTKSSNLYTQMVGRALRLYNGKTDALVLDFAGSTRTLDLVSLNDVVEGVDTRRVSPDSDNDPGQDEPTGKAVTERVTRQGILEMEHRDLLAATKGRWLQTHSGIHFLPGEKYYTFLYPVDSELFQVGYTTTSGAKTGGWLSYAEPFNVARFIADNRARRLGDFPQRSANQLRNHAPTPNQLSFARRLGIAVPEEGFTKARMTDEIARELATRRLKF